MNEKEFLDWGIEIKQFLGFKRINGILFGVYKSRDPFAKNGRKLILKAETSHNHNVDELIPHLKYKRY